jgi:hypothetical protein
MREYARDHIRDHPEYTPEEIAALWAVVAIKVAAA